MKKHWYFIYITECQICGKTTIDRERRYGRRPKDPMKRREWTPVACSHHFL